MLNTVISIIAIVSLCVTVLALIIRNGFVYAAGLALLVITLLISRTCSVSATADRIVTACGFLWLLSIFVAWIIVRIHIKKNGEDL